MSGEEKMPDMRYAAGMDGGGTKTVLEARAPDGRVLLRERFGSLNLNSAAAQAVRETMQGCTDALARLPGGLEACAALCVGSAGVSNPQARALLEQMVRIPGRASFDRRPGNRAGRRAGRTLRHGAYRGHRVHLFWQGCSG